jgi:AhpC/TSA family protein
MPLFAGLLLLLISPLAMFAQAPLGPLDGSDLSPYDLNRVVAGSMAPDFRLQDENGKVHQLSQYRGKNVVLVMYRGYW